MTGSESSAVPRAVRSRSALAANAAAASASGGTIADLRRDAWGHGLVPVAEALVEAGVRAALVDDEDAARRLRARGMQAETHGTPDIAPSTLYGLPDARSARPVLRLVGRVMSTKMLRAGEAVSYGYTHRAVADTRVALVSGGYAQGIARALGNRAHVEIDGTLRPIIGRVAMDVCVVDLGGLADPVGTVPGRAVAVGAEVTYFGGAGPARRALAEWAEVTGLTPAELLVVAAQHSVLEEEA